MTKVFVATKKHKIFSPCLFNGRFKNYPGGFALFNYNMAYMRWPFNLFY